ncbi:Spy/CpxP family protein refolding chaperone [Ammonifex degensii]|uniref:Spy/CpxP family protein refolding chaperone n=1 Tax=Ammonifex degensii TaxID=42838 RepID=UPI000673E04D
MWRSKKLLVALVLVLTLAFAIPVFAQTAAGRKQGIPANRPNLVQELGLTSEQLAQIRDIQQQMYNQTRDLRIKLMDAMFELRQLRWQENPDRAAIDAKIKEIKNLRDQLRQAAREYRQKMDSILTPEQKEKLQSLRGSRGWHGRGGMMCIEPGFRSQRGFHFWVGNPTGE